MERFLYLIVWRDVTTVPLIPHPFDLACNCSLTRSVRFFPSTGGDRGEGAKDHSPPPYSSPLKRFFDIRKKHKGEEIQVASSLRAGGVQDFPSFPRRGGWTTPRRGGVLLNKNNSHLLDLKSDKLFGPFPLRKEERFAFLLDCGELIFPSKKRRD
ncbi:hypothetical protein MNBD_NITROSPINAE04-1287 [hydrothermal vent metagenome]|uniref:Uncharacterized protein n=1 Tax=hydrothermal vent metagenome TaxID=652676 RepID=A0A3B1CE39_9ZZZZ